MAIFKLGLTRDQLASFLQDFEQIKQFEKLFSEVDDLSESKVKVDLSALAPAQENNGSVATDYIDYSTTSFTPAPHIGRTFWDGGNTLNIQQTLNVAGKVNEDNFFFIKATSAITKGQLVMFTGAVGSSGVMTGAPSSIGLGVNDGVRLMGIAAEDIPNNNFGLVQWSGVLRGFNTTGSSVGESWADGDILYYNPAYVGSLTNARPNAPNVRAVVAAVVNAGSGGSGSIAIRISAGSVLGDTDSNVQFTTLADGDIIQYDNALGYWKNIPVLGVTHGGTGTGVQFTDGSIVFAGASGVYNQNNGSLFWDRTNKRLGIGTNLPAYDLSVERSSDALTEVNIFNSNAGNSAASRYAAVSDAGTINIQAGSSTHTGNPITGGANGGGVWTTSGLTAGLSLGTAAGPIRFFAGGTSTVRATLDTSGNLGIGVVPSGTYKLEVNGSAYASSLTLGTQLSVANGGTGATTFTANGVLYGNTA